MAAAERTVLIADADHAIRSFVCLTLESDTTTVLEAADVDSALALLADHRPDVALVDARLPAGGGVGACRRLKQEAGDDELRTVLLVPRVELSAARASHNPSVDSFLTKPFTSFGLLRTVADLLAEEDG